MSDSSADSAQRHGCSVRSTRASDATMVPHDSGSAGRWRRKGRPKDERKDGHHPGRDDEHRAPADDAGQDPAHHA
jgi:hypothetical protein